MAVLLLTATGLRASDLVSKISNATVKWYSDVNKNTEITSVTLTTSPQTVYLDIQPASGYWTSETDLNGEVEKFASIGAAGTRASGPTFPEKSKVTKVNGQTYAPNGAGVYQVILPALASGQVASDIEKLVLTGTVNECTSISGATVDNDPDYNGGAQSAVIKLGTTTLTKGTDYEVAAGSSDSRTGAGV